MFSTPQDDGVTAVLPFPEGFDPELGWDGVDPATVGEDFDMMGGSVTPPSGQSGQQALPHESGLALAPKASPPVSPVGFVPGGAGQVKPVTMAIAFASFGLSPLLRDPLLNALQCPEDADPEVFTMLPESDVHQVLGQVVIGEAVRSPSPFERGQLFLFFKKLRRCWEEPPATTTTALVPAPSQPITVTLPDTSNRLHYKDYLDQTLGTAWFTLLPLEQIRSLRKRFETLTGAHAEGDARPSDAQISAMAHRVRPQPNGSLESPFAEFAVFGPFDGRATKLRQFMAHVLTRDGTWAQRLLRSPPSFAQWSTCWKVYANTLVMLDIAKVGHLQHYYSGIARLYGLFPRDWPSIAAYDEEMRAEMWPRLQQEIADGSLAAPLNHNLAHPWGTIIAATRFGYSLGLKADWWREREIALERGQQSRPGAKLPAPLGEAAEPPPLPAFSRVGQQAQGWGSGGEVESMPKAKAKAQPWQAAKGRGKGKRDVGSSGLPVAKKGPCWHCGGAHMRESCNKWIQEGRPDSKGGGKGGNGETRGQGEAAGRSKKAARKSKRKAS